MATNLPGVFAGGDVTTGPASVAEAIAAGRKAADAIHAYLTGGKKKGKLEGRPARHTGIEFNAVALTKTVRAKVTEVPPAQRKLAQEDRSTLDQRAVEEEAQRCANCGCVAVNASDIAPALVALGATIKTTKRTIGADEFFAVSQMKATTLDADELVTEITIPAPKAGSRQSFLKFRIRNSIDFPIVSVASVLTMAGGRVKTASIALGAVAPLPLRAREVEAYLKGKTLDGPTAAEAGAIAIKGTRPLAQNKFKVQIAGALLRKALLSENESV
jgi:xanthine dehydrogenase iron-sulfur cluster and FAD-binding subunit A